MNIYLDIKYQSVTWKHYSTRLRSFPPSSFPK